MSSNNKKAPTIVSACLAGVACRYDCQAKPNDKIIAMIQKGEALPLCPEQLGGLATPRDPAEIQNDKVISNNGKDVTKNYYQGAQEALKLAKLSGSSKAIIKSNSPMCGYGKIYDGSFSGKIISGNGIFAQLLIDNGFKVSSEND